MTGLRPGWRHAAWASCRRWSGTTRCRASPTMPTPPASPRRPWRHGSSPTPTSGPASGSCRWLRGSARGDAGTPRGPGTRYPGRTSRPPRGPGWADETANLVVARADALEREICGLAGVEPHGVRRLAGRAAPSVSPPRTRQPRTGPFRDRAGHRLLPWRGRLRAGQGGRGDRPPPRARDGRGPGPLAGDRFRDERRPDRRTRGYRPDVRRRLRGRGHGPRAAAAVQGRARGPGTRAGRRGPGQRPRLRGAGRRREQAGGDVRGARGGRHQGRRGGARVRRRQEPASWPAGCATSRRSGA